MNNPKISILVPSYNQGAYIEHTILSVLKQNYQNWELIIQNMQVVKFVRFKVQTIIIQMPKFSRMLLNCIQKILN